MLWALHSQALQAAVITDHICVDVLLWQMPPGNLLRPWLHWKGYWEAILHTGMLPFAAWLFGEGLVGVAGGNMAR